MAFRSQDNDEHAPSEAEVFKGFSNRLARATDNLQRIVQKHDQAFRLSMITTLPMTESYRLISLHGLDFATTVADLLQEGCSIAQALMIATQGIGADVLVLRRLAASPTRFVD